MGGIGKSTMAAALANDADVWEEFPDGIFWLTVGQKPNVSELRLQLAKWLGVEWDVLDAKKDPRRVVAESLTSRRLLLILDDVWDARHAEALMPDGAEAGWVCSVMVTTRDQNVLNV